MFSKIKCFIGWHCWVASLDDYINLCPTVTRTNFYALLTGAGILSIAILVGTAFSFIMIGLLSLLAAMDHKL